MTSIDRDLGGGGETSFDVANPDIRERLLCRIDLTAMRGLEIGPLHNPRVHKDEANVRYLDHASAEELRAKYANNPDAAPHAGALVDVDYVWSPGRDLRQVIGDWWPVDYVVASHVFEHIANPIAWLQQIEDCLTDDGVLSLVIPDKRFCFDARRSETTLAQLVDLYLRDIDVTTFQQIFDHESNYLNSMTTEALWSGQDPHRCARRSDVEDARIFAYERCLTQKSTGEYMDVHATVVTPGSFVELVGDVAEMGLTRFEIAEIFPTDRGSYEFFVTLVKRPVARADAAWVRRARAKVRAFEATWPPRDGRGDLMIRGVSDRELRLILAKRRLFDSARRILAKGRARLSRGGRVR